ncbi:protein RRNAD1-like isoform X2 [Pararge aegeria]|uniref:protein RRNAD1-like isoform X2 n=1 Tax=Pararge aegeria TaxID=116150 RepID=UPI0019CFE447|nr:protein RRNAD1-like isoform X2 [Pararge aegeria]
MAATCTSEPRVDFFVDNHWEKLPATWQQSLEKLDPKDLGDILSGNKTVHILPLSLLALFKTIKSLNIPRQGYNSIRSNKVINKCSCDHPKLKNLFIKHVKLKKRHEANTMAEFVSIYARQSNCNAVVDFGSGLGHLIRILSYKYNVHSVGIEMQTRLTEEARKLDSELEYTVKKYLTEEQMSNLIRPIHCNITLSSIEQLRELALPVSVLNYGLIGLHPCGDLGPLLIKHFVNSNEVKFICVVGCCYMKLSCKGESCSYPMSRYVGGLDCGLSYISREISCHAIETYCERLCRGEYNDLKVHAFRAALEKLLVQLDPELKHMPVRSVKHTNNMTFNSYCEAALNQISVQPLEYDSVKEDLGQWKKVVILYTLRLALAPLVETVILLDRVLFMLENNISCAIYPVFDPKISPRNHIIVGRKL